MNSYSYSVLKELTWTALNCLRWVQPQESMTHLTDNLL